MEINDRRHFFIKKKRVFINVEVINSFTDTMPKQNIKYILYF